MTKLRLSATVEDDVLAAGRAAVADGRAESLSAWVNDALRRQAEHDRRMKALDEFLATYEAEHGEITDEEMREAARRARSRAVVVRAAPGKKKGASGSRRRGAA
jgi:Arc/MetJ-type ribon-helix-helix transcriptional regulator